MIGANACAAAMLNHGRYEGLKDARTLLYQEVLDRRSLQGGRTGELASAFEHIHGLRLGGDADARLVHKDLKPDNVMVRSLEPLDLVLGDSGWPG